MQTGSLAPARVYHYFVNGNETACELETCVQHYCQETMSNQTAPLEVAGTLETRRLWRLLPAVISSAWHGVGQELSF